MAVKRLSPTANLLRKSRLFSLPPPLPKPSTDFTATANFDSDTATLPYPTHATIETTQASLSRGDWGLKRPLPSNSIAKATPSIRIHDVDSIDHITNFDSAADHAVTLQKWQEMGIPMSMPLPRRRASEISSPRFDPLVSAFESSLDNTEGSNRATDGRWKYKGPWLAGKTAGDFNDYTRKKVKPRKLEFRHFLRQRLVESITAERQRTAMDSGEEILRDPVEVSESEVETYIKQLRTDEERLYALVGQFLDLPTASETTGRASIYSERGPPMTHPSAGLSYLRTKSHISNHPNLGPMQVDAPVQGRVLAPQKVGGKGARARALVGVGGFAADDVKVAFHRSSEISGVAGFDPEIPGGAKLWIHPESASIDSHGRTELRWSDRADANAIMIYHNQTSAKSLPAVTAGQNWRVPQLDRTPRTTAAGGRGRGYGLESTEGESNRGRTRGLLGPNEKPPAQDEIQALLP